MHDTTRKSVPTRVRSPVAKLLAGGVLLALAIGAFVSARADAPAPVTGSSAEKAEHALAALVAERIAELDVKPKTVIAPSDRALEASVAIKRGDYAQARRITADILAHSRQQKWTFYPFSEFMDHIIGGDDPVLLEHLNQWIAREPDSAFAYLIRGHYYAQAAFAARGTELPWKVPDRLMKLFKADLALALADIHKSISLNRRIPWSYYELVRTAGGNGNSPEVDAAFQQAVRAMPTYYPMYESRLRTLRPKWGGSVADMYEFVEQYAGHARDTSPLQMLYMDLYVNLLDAGGFDCRSRSGNYYQSCLRDEMQQFSRPDLQQGMQKALNLYKVSDPIEFSTALWPLLETMACCVGSPAAVGGVLQMAASVMGSDNRIVDDPGHNSYVLDDVTARVWVGNGNPANADRKFREALSDVEHTRFSDEAQKAAARAMIYDHMAQVAYDAQQFIDLLVYLDAADLAGGDNHSSLQSRKCYAYYRLQHYAETVRACTPLIEGNGNYLDSHYWRGKAYEALGQWDASIADFEPVADGPSNYYRVGAALDMSFDYGQKRDYAGQLAAMNRYPYLFDDKMQPAADLAVSFNNRCFALMQLGQLQQALDDCTRSLQYGRLPDAFQKQQELLQRLGKTASR